MNNEAAVEDGGVGATVHRAEDIRVCGLIGVGIDGAVLAAQITNLASLRVRLVTGRRLAADGRVQVRAGRGTVSIIRDLLLVDVVGWE